MGQRFGISSVIVVVLSVGLFLSGCSKSDSTNAPTGSTAGAAAAGAKVAETDVTGVWQATKMQDDQGKPLTGGIFSDLLTTRIEVRADHSYGMSNRAIGYTFGTWAIKDNALALTVHTSYSPWATLAFESPRLVDHESGSVTFYEKQGPASADVAAKFSMTAAQFLDDVKKDFEAAKTKYNYARVDITGVVTMVQTGTTGAQVMVSGPPTGDKTFDELPTGLHCESFVSEPWATVARMQPVKVSGVAFLMNGDAMLSEAKFTLDGPSVIVGTTPEALAAEYAKDKEATNKKYSVKYDGKTLLISGPVLEIQDATTTLVVGTDGANVICDCSRGGRTEAFKSAQIGKTVKISGEYNPNASKKSPEMINCNLVLD